MKVRTQDTVLAQVRERILAGNDMVVLRKDFSDLGNYRTVGKALRALVAEGVLVRIGYGLYARAELSPLTGRPMLPKGLFNVTAAALDRLQVPWQPGRAYREYNAGRTTQVPGSVQVSVKKRLSRKIAWNRQEVRFELWPR